MFTDRHYPCIRTTEVLISVTIRWSSLFWQTCRRNYCLLWCKAVHATSWWLMI